MGVTLLGRTSPVKRAHSHERPTAGINEVKHASHLKHFRQESEREIIVYDVTYFWFDHILVSESW